jgi:hypothetical protein
MVEMNVRIKHRYFTGAGITYEGLIHTRFIVTFVFKHSLHMANEFDHKWISLSAVSTSMIFMLSLIEIMINKHKDRFESKYFVRFQREILC